MIKDLAGNTPSPAENSLPMETLSTNTFEDFCLAAVLVFLSLMLARYVCRFLQRLIDKEHFGPLPEMHRRSLMRISGLINFFIPAMGALLALSMFSFQPASSELASLARTTLTLFCQIALLLILTSAIRTGFEIRVSRILTISWNGDHGRPDLADTTLATRIKKARTLIALLPLPLSIIILLPDLELNVPKNLVLAAASLFFLIDLLFLAGITARLKKEPSAAIPAAAILPPSIFSIAPQLSEELEGRDPDFQLIVKIATLFLNIVKHHLGAGAKAAVRFTLVEHDTATSKYLFELQVHLFSNWKKRRVTIGRLGADTGSRSKCFYVIFDDYLVIKIPPEPITENNEYIDSLKLEGTIARQLEMEACIIPTVSVILKYLDRSIEDGEYSPGGPEAVAMSSLRRHPELFQFLKVGETFAYFMDMSQYFVLQNVVRKLHHTPGLSEETRFMRTKIQVEGIVANLLTLLARIDNQGVALRDLKPDNLLVAGNRDDYPAFLAKFTEYSIGLIDIETAVVYGNPPRQWINQPQLGGTPQYATPAHFFKNKLLQDLYGEVAGILHLQDWHGMIGVIFKVISNRFLFGKTARIIPTIVQKLKSRNKDFDFQTFAVQVSCLFWKTAALEFKMKMTQENESLEKLLIPISESALAMLKKMLSAEKIHIAAAINEQLADQTFYPTDKSRLALQNASPQSIEQLAGKLAELSEDLPELTKHRLQAYRFLHDLKDLKLQLEQQTQVLKLLAEPAPRLNARLLLETMFSVVRRRMYLESWKKSLPQDLDSRIVIGPDGPSDTDQKKTCMEFQTIETAQTMKE